MGRTYLEKVKLAIEEIRRQERASVLAIQLKTPETLQEQIDAAFWSTVVECRAHPHGPWAVPLPWGSTITRSSSPTP